jgi:hypothetical protein
VPPAQAVDHTHQTLLLLWFAHCHGVGRLLFDEFEAAALEGSTYCGCSLRRRRGRRWGRR